MAWDIYGYDSPTHYRAGLSATIGETLLTRRYFPCPLSCPPGNTTYLPYGEGYTRGDVSLRLNACKVFYVHFAYISVTSLARTVPENIAVLMKADCIPRM